MTDSPYVGIAQPMDAASEANALRFAIAQMLARVETATLAQVVRITGGGTGATGLVDVLPLVARIDGRGAAIPQGIINNVPYLRLQGGASAVICDPAPGDIGICLFASRDISAVKASKAAGPPGSYRRFDQSDALFIPSVLGAPPAQWIEFATDGIHIHTGATIFLDGNVVATGTLTSNGKDVSSTHQHGGVTTGTGNTGAPI